MSSSKEAISQYDAIISIPFCHLGLKFNEGQLVSTEYLEPASKVFQSDSPDASKLLKQIQYYLKDPEFHFQVNLKAEGTEFQQKIWKLLAEIPAGTVKTYGELAKQTSSSAQAVGNACRANPVPLIIPCHRVVSATGIGGFAGSTSGYLVEIKRQLLKHEGLEF